MSTFYKALGPSLFLVQQTIDKAPAVEVARATNHIAIVDCSGSMASELPKLRAQLKRRLPSILRDGDTFSLIWFSGRGEFGALIEAEEIVGVRDLQDVHQRIDRWLRPVGLTGFKEPLGAALALAKLVEKTGNPIALFFMSDGQDNQWPREQILETVAALRGRIASATFVEYGPYADRQLLAAMAQRAGGRHLIADDFDRYAPIFERALTQPVSTEPRHEVKLAVAPLDGLVFTVTAQDIVTYEAVDAFDGKTKTYWNSKALVDGDVSTVFYLTTVKPAGGANAGCAGGGAIDVDSPRAAEKRMAREAVAHEDGLMTGAYAAMALYALRGRPDVIYPLLQLTGDVRFIKMFATCYGRQRTTEFSEWAKDAALDPDSRLLIGYDPKLVPNEDAFTILHLLEILQSDESTRVCLDHPAFEYSRISRKRLAADENLTIAEAARVEEIRLELEGERNAAKVRELHAEIDSILATKRDALKFVADPAPDGYPIEGLVFNEDEPNVSIRVKIPGVVDLTTRAETAPTVFMAVHDNAVALPAFPTYTWRNYALVQNGLINVKRLPVKISAQVSSKLTAAGVEMEVIEGAVVINLSRLPMLNRSMVKSLSLRDAVELEYALTRSRAYQKVFRHVMAQRFPDEKLAGLVEVFGTDGAAWLAEQGITSNGFAPKMTVAPSVDFITARALAIKLAGYSKLPKVEDVFQKIAKIDAERRAPAKMSKTLTKLNGPEELMADALDEINGRLTLIDQAKAESRPGDWDATLKAWLLARTREIVVETRALISRMARMKWAVTVGQAWFQEFKSLDENTLEVTVAGIKGRPTQIKATAELREIQIKV